MERNTLMKPAELEQGYIGSSRSSTSINAIIWAGDEEFYFFVVTPFEAAALDRWLDEGKPAYGLDFIFPNMAENERSLFETGEAIDATSD